MCCTHVKYVMDFYGLMVDLDSKPGSDGGEALGIAFQAIFKKIE